MTAKEAVDEILQGDITEFHRQVASLPHSEIETLLVSILDLPEMDNDYSTTPEYRIVKEAMTPFFAILRGISDNIDADREELSRRYLVSAEPYIQELNLASRGFVVYHAYTSGFSAIKCGNKGDVTLHVQYSSTYKAVINKKNIENEYTSSDELIKALSKL